MKALLFGVVADAQEAKAPKPGLRTAKPEVPDSKPASGSSPQTFTKNEDGSTTFRSPDGDINLRIEEVECGLWCDFASPLTFGGPILGSLVGMFVVSWLHVRAVRASARLFRGTLPLLATLWVQPLAVGVAIFAVMSVIPAILAALFTDFRALWLVIIMRPPFQFWSLFGFILVVSGPYGYAVARTSARSGPA